MKKIVPRKKKFKLYNVVVHPVGKQSKTTYIDIFRKISEQAKSYETAKGKHTKIHAFSNVYNGELYQCNLVNFAVADDNEQWYNQDSDELIPAEQAPNIGTAAKEWILYLFPENHRIAVEMKPGISWAQIESFLLKGFADACATLFLDEVKLTQETTQEGIEQIFSLETVDSIEIEVSYSNNDTNDITTQILDDDLKKSNVGTLKTKITSSKGSPMTIDENSGYVSSLIKLSQHNGKVKARGNIGMAKKSFNTYDYPIIVELSVIDEKDLLTQLIDKLRSIFKV
jgi:hypothetical protein